MRSRSPASGYLFLGEMMVFQQNAYCRLRFVWRFHSRPALLGYIARPEYLRQPAIGQPLQQRLGRVNIRSCGVAVYPLGVRLQVLAEGNSAQ